MSTRSKARGSSEGLSCSCSPMVTTSGRAGPCWKAMHGGIALATAGIGLAHAMAQSVGGSYGIHHGAANALCLPRGFAFNEAVVGAEISRFGDALGASDPGRPLREVCSPLRVWAAARSRRPRGWVARGGGSDCEPAGRTCEPEAGLATADLRALPLHLVKGDRPVSRRRGVYIIDGSDDADVDGWQQWQARADAFQMQRLTHQMKGT
jgi:hypothetical protein